SYFQRGKDHTARVAILVSRIADVNWIVTDTELEALMLECTLIKRHHPRYNVHLRDDKSYPYLRISVQEKWPQISVVRRPRRDEAVYFGPYTSAYSIRETMRFLTKIFPVRDCSPSKFKNRTRPCINYDIGICAAPCVNYITEANYRKIVDDLVLFLKGKNKPLLKDLMLKMKQLSSEMEYEKAGKMRDRIRAINELLEKQKVVSLSDVNQDVIGFFRYKKHIEVAILFIRAGSLLGKKSFSFSGIEPELKEEGAFLSSFINQYYDEHLIPDEVLLSEEPEDKALLEAYLKEKKGKEVLLTIAKGADMRAMVGMAEENAREAMRGKNLSEGGPQVLEQLRRKLHLRNDPHRMECFDISNISGMLAVGSRVTFIEGERVTRLYRKYKIKTVEGPNDYWMMHEALSRRFRNEDPEGYPDLLIVDGGKSQLSSALRVLAELKIGTIDVIALAKEKTESSFEKEEILKLEERVYLPGQKNPVIFKRESPVLHLLQRIRDEAHRFAISYHKKLREKEFLRA
ncbi:MAG: excinuclease ABC subunit UvrC, partial [Deltaproteobacteria bacterium]